MSEQADNQHTHTDDSPPIISYASAKTSAIQIDGRCVAVVIAGATVGAAVGWCTFETVLRIFSDQYEVGEASEPFRVQSSFALATSLSGAWIGMAAAIAWRRSRLWNLVLWLHFFAMAWFVGGAVGVLLKREQWKVAQTPPPMPLLPPPYQNLKPSFLPPPLVDAPIYIGPVAGCVAVLILLIAVLVSRSIRSRSSPVQHPSLHTST